MKKKKKSSRNLVFSAAMLVIFLGFLAGVMIWEANRPVEPVPTETQGTEPVSVSIPEETTVPTTCPPETTLPKYTPRQINFLLVGRDWHAEGENGRSDSMILCRIDTGAKTVTMISFLRDIYLEIPGYGSSRLNSAYSWGGAQLLKQTLNQNFDVEVDVTLEIDFDGFENIIDYLGGVDIELTQREVNYLLNGHAWDLVCGMNHLDGEQALAYSRIRYLDSDFFRTERQRNVLTALLEKYRDASYLEMLNATDAFLDQSTSDHTDEELLGLAVELYEMMDSFEISTYRIPADGTYTYETIRGMSVIGVDFEKNRELLAELLQ